MSRNQLIVQLPLRSQADFDIGLQLEESLFQAFSMNDFGVVDGHDVGEGRFNIFIYPKGSWVPVLERVHAYLKLRGLRSDALVVKRMKKSERFVVVWPEGFKGDFSL